MKRWGPAVVELVRRVVETFGPLAADLIAAARWSRRRVTRSDRRDHGEG